MRKASTVLVRLDSLLAVVCLGLALVGGQLLTYRFPAPPPAPRRIQPAGVKSKPTPKQIPLRKSAQRAYFA